MARIALIIIAVSVLAGSLFFIWKPWTDSRADESSIDATTPLEMRNIVLMTRDVDQGGTITADAVELRQGFNHQNHLYPVETIELAIGRKSRYGISKGQAIFPQDLDPYPPGFTSVSVISRRLIPKGKTIKATDIEEVEIETTKLPDSGALTSAKVIGKRSKIDIDGSELISVEYLEP